jgi:uncharacterized membrane protein
MGKTRLEAFSDGVIAILITIMVLELHVPDQTTWEAVRDELPVLLSYVLSFVYLGIYWTNHHHMIQVTDRVDGAVLWANLHLLFWLSLVPFVTAWTGENHFEAAPTACYGVVLLMCAVAYAILARVLVVNHEKNTALAEAIGDNRKGKISIVLYVVGAVLAWFSAWLGFVVYAAVAAMWLIPDRRIEKKVEEDAEREEQDKKPADE